MTESPPKKSEQQRVQPEYLGRINRVIDHIEAHLGEELTLEQLAQVASFSRFHFHRVFKAMVGETLYQFIQRLRLEKAAAFLTYNPRMSVTEIALDCGFSSSAAFARAFKEAFQMSATQWREETVASESKIGKAKSKICNPLSNGRKAYEVVLSYPAGSINNPIWRISMKDKNKTTTRLETEVEVKDVPELPVAYLRHVGPYQGDYQLFGRLFGQLMGWAGPRGLLRFPETKMLTVYHDNPDITDEEKLRMSVCISVPADTKVEGEVGKMVIPGGRYAVAHFEIATEQFAAAWDTVYGGWLPASGYQPDDRPCFELYLNNPEEHPEKKHIFDIYAPVKPL